MARQEPVAGRSQRARGPPRPGRARAAPGRSCERRWVRFRIPALTCADVPSGATSVSRTTAVATGAETARWRTTSGTPRISTAVHERLGRVGRAERLVGTQVAGQAVRWAAGAPRQGGPGADGRPVAVPVDAGRRRVRGAVPSAASAADERQRPAGEPPRPRSTRRDAGTRSPPASAPAASPGTAPARRTRVRTRRPPARRRRRWGCPSASGRRSGRARGGRRGSGRAWPTPGSPWTQLPTIVRARGGAARPASGAPRRRTNPSSRRR